MSGRVNCPARSASSQVRYFCSNPFKQLSGSPNHSIKDGLDNWPDRLQSASGLPNQSSRWRVDNCPPLKKSLAGDFTRLLRVIPSRIFLQLPVQAASASASFCFVYFALISAWICSNLSRCVMITSLMVLKMVLIETINSHFVNKNRCLRGVYGGWWETRTPDIFGVNEALYQLS